MKKLLAALLLSILPSLALAANTSTINPSIPVQNAPVSSAPMRSNFQAAYNDINTIYGILSGISGAGPGGLLNQIQFNAGGGLFGGFAMNGDCTLTVSTGAIVCTSTNGLAFAPSATTDTTNAANISSGTLPSARLPNPSAGALGGVESVAAAANNWITSISTLGVPVLAQPGFSNLSGSLSSAQLPALTSASIWVGNVSNAATALALSGDCSLANTGAITCTKSSGSSFGTAAFVNTGTSGATVPLLNGNNTFSGSTSLAGTTLSGITGSVQCLHVNSSGVISGTAGDCATGGSGTVTSVGVSTDRTWLTVASSPVTTSGTITVNGTTGLTANQVIATPDGSTGAVSLRALVGADLPSPTISTLGGVKSKASAVHNYLTQIGTDGSVLQAQPAFSDISSTLATAQLPGLTATDIWVGNGSAIATAVALSGDCTLSNAGLITCTKTNGSSFGTAATQNTGVSGAVVPLLNGNNVYSGTSNFTGSFSISGTAETFPSSGLIVGTTDTQTLTNKSIAASEVNSGTLAVARMPGYTNAVASAVAMNSFGGL